MVDFVLLHPPSVYDFREKAIMHGPISDVVPSTSIFESYPIGFISMLGYLHQHGYRVRIINVALKMLNNPSFNPEKLIKSLDPLAFGIDLHWLVHAQGSLKLAEIVKRWHPDTPVIIGGLSATYFHTQIVRNYPYVDYVIRGDTTEEPLLQLLNCIERGKDPVDVPNLTWKDSDDRVQVNSLSFIPENLDEYILDYGAVIKSAIKNLDIEGHFPYRDWLKYPLAAVLTCKGCIYNCITCGGSKYSYQKVCSRSRVAFKSAEKLVEEMKIIGDYIKGPIFVLNDIRIGGKKYVENLLKEIKKERIHNPLIIELFKPASRRFLEDVIKASGEASLEISPESHDEMVRRSFGRNYGNEELERTLAFASELGYKRIDVFFMIGLPYQDMESVLKTVRYAEKLIQRYGKGGRLHPFIAPLAPFVDPGSLVFENPDLYGYHLFFKSLEEYRTALELPSWKYSLSYQTRWMTRDDIVNSTYKAARLLNTIKKENMLISEVEAEAIFKKLQLAEILTRKVDEIFQQRNEKIRLEQLQVLSEWARDASKEVLCSSNELLKWPFGSITNIKLRLLFSLIKNLIKSSIKRS